MEEIQKNFYEIAFYVKDENAAPVKEAVASAHGEVAEEKPFEKVKLEFPIEKESYAFLGALRVALPPEEVSAVSRALTLAPGVLRHLITAAPSVVAEEGVREERKPSVRPRPTAPVRSTLKEPPMLTNEAIEKKIEEILQ